MLILLRILILCFLVFTAPQSLLLAQTSYEALPDGGVIDEISARNMDIAEVLALISRKSGLNIVTGQNVTGRVTVFLRDVDAREALRTVLEMNGLAFAEEGGIIRVMTADEYASRYGQTFGQSRVTRIIKLQYVPLKDLVPLLMELKSSDGKVIPNEEARSIAIMDTAEKVKAMEKLIREVDLQTATATIPLAHVRAGDICEEVRGMAHRSVGMVECDMALNRIVVTDTLAGVERIRRAVEALDAKGLNILLEARLVHIILNDEHLDGVDWSGIVSDVRDIRLEGNYSFMNSGARGALVSLGVVADEDLQPLIEALDTVGIVREYTQTDIMVTPDVAARLTLYFDEPNLVLSETAPGALENSREDTGPFTSFALEFLVKPVVDPEGNITASILPYESARALKGAVRRSHGESLEFMEGNSLVLGSVITARNKPTVRKIPLVGDIPILGFAFRYHRSSLRREEFIVVLTPKVVKAPPAQAAGQKETTASAVDTSSDRDADPLSPAGEDTVD